MYVSRRAISGSVVAESNVEDSAMSESRKGSPKKLPEDLREQRGLPSVQAFEERRFADAQVRGDLVGSHLPRDREVAHRQRGPERLFLSGRQVPPLGDRLVVL